MSGGIDSTVCAVILQQMGYEVLGITFRLHEETSGENIAHLYQEVTDHCASLGIRHEIIDLREIFNTRIIGYFTDEYLKGKTPFPCVVCNNKIKWPYLLNYAQKFGCAYISTGHYAGIYKAENKFYIKCAADAEKDQSFFLWGLSQEVLKKIIFPLNSLTKTQVKEIAENSGFGNLVHKKESTGPCFIKGNNYRPFLVKQLKDRNLHISGGLFVTPDGNVIGNHNGYPYYTIGQRRGLGLELNQPVYVSKIDHKTNTIVLGNKKSLYKNCFSVCNYNITDYNDFQSSPVIVKIRYRKQKTPCEIEIESPSKLNVKLREPLDSIAPGQTAVFYSGNIVLGGGFIC